MAGGGVGQDRAERSMLHKRVGQTSSTPPTLKLTIALCFRRCQYPSSSPERIFASNRRGPGAYVYTFLCAILLSASLYGCNHFRKESLLHKLNHKELKKDYESVLESMKFRAIKVEAVQKQYAQSQKLLAETQRALATHAKLSSEVDPLQFEVSEYKRRLEYEKGITEMMTTKIHELEAHYVVREADWQAPSAQFADWEKLAQAENLRLVTELTACGRKVEGHLASQPLPHEHLEERDENRLDFQIPDVPEFEARVAPPPPHALEPEFAYTDPGLYDTERQQWYYPKEADPLDQWTQDEVAAL
eukprot:gene13152-3470_t